MRVIPPTAAEGAFKDGCDIFLAELANNGKRGLWFHGPRQSGSSRMMRQFYLDHPDVFPYECMTRKAGVLEQELRELWKLEQAFRKAGDDKPLWDEICGLERKLKRLWQAKILWIDDLYVADVDAALVRKNMLLNMDVALKNGSIVLVCGNAAPEVYGTTDWALAIRETYVVVDLADPKKVTSGRR